MKNKSPFEIKRKKYKDNVKAKEGLKVYENLVKHMENLLKEITKEHIRQGEQQNKIDSHIHFIILKNLSFFQSHVLNLKNGLIIPSYSNLRSIFEGIIRNYYAKLDSEFEKYIYHILNKQPLSSKERKQYRGFGVKQAYESVYTKQYHKTFEQIYSNLCKYNHPEIQSAFPIHYYSEETLNDCLAAAKILVISQIVQTYLFYNGFIKVNRCYTKKYFRRVKENTSGVLDRTKFFVPPDYKDRFLELNNEIFNI